MEQGIDLGALQALYEQLRVWIFEHVLVLATPVQLVAVGAAFLMARLFAPGLRGSSERLVARAKSARDLRQAAQVLTPLALPIIWLALLWLAVAIAGNAGWPNHLIKIAVSLLTAWVIIRFASRLVRDPTWSRSIAIIAWSIAALNILGLLGDTIALLDSLGLQLGDLRITVLTVIKGVLSLSILLWVAAALSRLLERRISTFPNLTPSIQVLFAKLLKVVLVMIAVVSALRIVGIDLTAFAVFSGAVGVGVGFGLQKVVSNLISGVILLVDKSVKPGDVISVGDTYGRIKALGARYASVITRDGFEFLIPNEDIITQQVVNWSYSDNLVRLKIPIGIAYKSDVREAIGLCLKSASEVPRVVKEAKTVCLLKGFGDSSVDLELRVRPETL